MKDAKVLSHAKARRSSFRGRTLACGSCVGRGGPVCPHVFFHAKARGSSFRGRTLACGSCVGRGGPVCPRVFFHAKARGSSFRGRTLACGSCVGRGGPVCPSRFFAQYVSQWFWLCCDGQPAGSGPKNWRQFSASTWPSSMRVLTLPLWRGTGRRSWLFHWSVTV